MTTRSRLEAELATQRYTRRHAREIVTAILGNNAGTVVATASTRWYWIRLHGDANQVVRAWNTGFVPPVPNLPVDVEIVKANNITDYQIIGVSINKGVAADVNSGATGSHALQHQRRDFNEGGFDPLDIYARAIIPLRARAQATPDMTLYVEPGFYSMLGVETYWAGGNSPAFVAPATGYRIDLLYLNAAGALTILAGTAAPFAPVRPATPTAGIVPIAFVYLAAATTAVTEYDIEDARVAFGSSGASGANALLDGVNHTDTLAGTVVDGDVIIGNVTPKWSRLAISIPAAGTLNYFGVNNGELRPSWKSASSNPGAAAAILATDASGNVAVQAISTGSTATKWGSGTAFPGSPGTNDRFFRTDLGWLCYYDGTRWLTANEWSVATRQQDTGLSTNGYDASYIGLRSDYAPWFTRVAISTYTATTNDGTNYWTVAVRSCDKAFSAFTTILTFNTSADTVNVWANHEANASTNNPANYGATVVQITKTNTPGVLFTGYTISYRLIVT